MILKSVLKRKRITQNNTRFCLQSEFFFRHKKYSKEKRQINHNLLSLSAGFFFLVRNLGHNFLAINRHQL